MCLDSGDMSISDTFDGLLKAINRKATFIVDTNPVLRETVRRVLVPEELYMHLEPDSILAIEETVSKAARILHYILHMLEELYSPEIMSWISIKNHIILLEALRETIVLMDLLLTSETLLVNKGRVIQPSIKSLIGKFTEKHDCIRDCVNTVVNGAT